MVLPQKRGWTNYILRSLLLLDFVYTPQLGTILIFFFLLPIHLPSYFYVIGAKTNPVDNIKDHTSAIPFLYSYHERMDTPKPVLYQLAFVMPRA